IITADQVSYKLRVLFQKTTVIRSLLFLVRRISSNSSSLDLHQFIESFVF
ncbi:unnamed protein product, partial [Brassica oleracea]